VDEQNKHNLKQLIHSITSRRSSLGALAEQLRTTEILAAFNKTDQNSWCVSVAGDALVRLRIFTEQNFNFIETMGIIAVARYIFELSVWLYLFKLDSRYGLVYFNQLLDTQHRYFQAVRAQLEREVAMLKSFGAKENDLREAAMENVKEFSGEDEINVVLSSLSSIASEIDAEASRQFSLYAKDAQTNGYEFQVYLIQTKAIPQVERALADIALEKDWLGATISQDIKDLIPRRWQWRAMAELVGLSDEYDYIYSFASKLLHATPASITTDQKNLELSEMQIFLKYIDVKLADIEALAAEYCRA
jgi:hypothetical protein